MNVSWVAADRFILDPTVDVESLKSIGPIWGSWTTWRSCGTDNVVCHDPAKAQELVARGFHNKANFFTHRSYYQQLNRPQGVKLYDGSYTEQVDSLEDIIALHLAAASSDIVLLLGFQFGKLELPEDQFEQHKSINRHGLMRSIIAKNPTIQWVAIDHPKQLDPKYQELTNLTCDKLKSVLKLLAQ